MEYSLVSSEETQKLISAALALNVIVSHCVHRVRSCYVCNLFDPILLHSNQTSLQQKTLQP